MLVHFEFVNGQMDVYSRVIDITYTGRHITVWYYFYDFEKSSVCYDIDDIAKMIIHNG